MPTTTISLPQISNVPASRLFTVDGLPRPKPRYVTWNRDRWCYQPKKEMKAHGIVFVAFGAEMTSAEVTMVDGLNAEWDQIMSGAVPAARCLGYQKDTVGWAFRQIMVDRATVRAHNGGDPHDEYTRSWKHIEPVFGQRDPKTVTIAELAAFQRKIEQDVSPQTRYRVMNVWWSLRSQMAMMGLVPARDPSRNPRFGTPLPIPNPAPPSRDSYWEPDEIDLLIGTAKALGFEALACIISIFWDSGLAPGDICKLTLGQLSPDHKTGTWYFDTARAKTKEAAIGTVRERSIMMLRAYDALLGGIADDSMIFRAPAGRKKPHTRSAGIGAFYADKPPHYLSHHFALVRKHAFGADERRIMYDVRRSGAMEADAGGASPEEIGAKLGNSLATNKKIRGIYTPPQKRQQIDRAIKSDGHREAGRVALRNARLTIAPVSGGALLRA